MVKAKSAMGDQFSSVGNSDSEGEGSEEGEGKGKGGGEGTHF